MEPAFGTVTRGSTVKTTYPDVVSNTACTRVARGTVASVGGETVLVDLEKPIEQPRGPNIGRVVRHKRDVRPMNAPIE